MCHETLGVRVTSAASLTFAEEEQRAAIERLMPPSERGKANGGKKKPKFRKIPISDGSSGAGNGKSQQKFSNLPSPPRLNEDEQDPRDVAKRKRLERKESEVRRKGYC